MNSNNPTAGDELAFTGDYDSWEEAVQNSEGYDSAIILERTRDAMRKIKSGEAVYERDSVLFDRPQYPWPLLFGLLRTAIQSGGCLSVADFGGALGSTYFQCRQLLRPLNTLEWSVIEQPAHVACGREELQSDQLRFYETMEECLAHLQPNLLLVSGVLQYLPNPYQTLSRLLEFRLNNFILDRTPFLITHRDRLTVQTVPESIYPASYPAWFFDETRLVSTIDAAGYRLIVDFPALDTISPADEPAYYKGYIFERRSNDK